MDDTKKRRWPFFLGLALFCAIVIGGYYLFNYLILYSNDAFLEANVIAIAPQVPGKIIKVNVKDLQYVKKGAPLFEIDQTNYKAELDLAKAKLTEIESDYASLQYRLNSLQNQANSKKANLDFQKLELGRYEKLLKTNAVPQEQVDKVRKAEAQALQEYIYSKQLFDSLARKLGASIKEYSAYKEATASLKLAQFNYDHTIVYAPVSGNITALDLQAGEYVNVGDELFALVDTSHWWVNAKIKENDLNGVVPGDKAYLYLPYGDGSLRGVVSGIAWGVNRKRYVADKNQFILPFYQRNVNWIQLAQRFPVKINIDKKSIRPNFRVGVTVHVFVIKKH